MDSNKAVTELKDDVLNNVSGGMTYGYCRCPHCKSPLKHDGDQLYCPKCDPRDNKNGEK